MAESKSMIIPVGDRVWAHRNWLRARGSQSHRLEDLPEALQDDPARLTVQRYRYTKAQDLTNDLLAYGERVLDVSWCPTAEEAEILVRVSRRTRSGKTPETERTAPAIAVGGAKSAARQARSAAPSPNGPPGRGKSRAKPESGSKKKAGAKRARKRPPSGG